MAGLMNNILSKLGFQIGNNNEYPLNSMNYFVIFGKAIFSFSKISGINLYTAKTAGITEGGMNEPYIVEEPNENLNTMRLEKGFGTADVLDFIDNAKMMILIIKGPKNSIEGVYYTSRMMVKDVVLSDLNAEKSTVLIQTLTISYTSLKKADAVMKAVSVGGMGEAIAGLLNYNDNSKDQAAIKEYSAKLSEAKKTQTAKANTEKTKKINNTAVKEAAKTNDTANKIQLQKDIEKNKQEAERIKNLQNKIQL